MVQRRCCSTDIPINPSMERSFIGCKSMEFSDNANMTVDLLAEQYAIEKIVTHEIAHQW